MNKIRLMTLVICTVLLLAILSPLSVMAQDSGPVAVSGSFNYIFEPLATLEANGNLYGDFVENEVWIGDIEGTAVAPFSLVVLSSGIRRAWLLADFEGTVLGEYEGTLVIMSTYDRPNRETHWRGEWMIISGTGELKNLRGHGIAWGPGSTNEDDGIIDLHYSGEVFFLEPASS